MNWKTVCVCVFNNTLFWQELEKMKCTFSKSIKVCGDLPTPQVFCAATNTSSRNMLILGVRSPLWCLSSYSVPWGWALILTLQKCLSSKYCFGNYPQKVTSSFDECTAKSEVTHFGWASSYDSVWKQTFNSPSMLSMVSSNTSSHVNLVTNNFTLNS